MLALRMDTKSELEVRWPGTDAQVIAAAQIYVAYEGSLPVANQLQDVSLAMIQAALTEAITAVSAAGISEQGRAVASEQYRQAMATAKPLLEIILLRLRGKYATNLAQLEGWGLYTKIGTNGISVLKPKGDKGWAEFLMAYVAKEQSLPANEQISDPPLAQMSALATTIQQSLTAREAGRTQREIYVRARSEAGTRLLNLLQAAAVVLVTTRYDGKVTNELQQWGYNVSRRTTPRAEEENGNGETEETKTP